MSVDSLAEAAGVAASTVRAHESGQNKIKPEVAILYGNALHVSPDWLLFGRGVGPHRAVNSARTIPVLGEVRRGAWIERFDNAAERFLLIETPGYEPFSLAAYRTPAWDGKGPVQIEGQYQPSSILITANLSDIGFGGRDVILERKQGRLTELSVRKPLALPNPPRLKLIAGGWTDESSQRDGLPREELDYLQLDPEEARIVGVVIGVYWLAPNFASRPFKDGTPEDLANQIQQRDLR